MTLPEPLGKIVDKFIELHGDRVHGETEQVRCGLGWIGKQRFVLILHNHLSPPLLGTSPLVGGTEGGQGGNDLSIGYRKALRMLRLAEQLKRPVLWYVENTAVAGWRPCKETVSNLSLDLLNNINENIRTILNLKVPIIGVFSLSASKSALISPNIVDHAILLTNKRFALLLTDNDTALETSREDVEVISLDDLSSLRTRLIDKFAEISQISSSDLISQRIDRIKAVNELL